jgi:mono/diheme cytochrome c family protein
MRRARLVRPASLLPVLASALSALCLGLAAGAALAVPPLGRQATPRANAESVATATSTRSLFVMHCVGCHGRDAAGSEIGQVPDMRRVGRFMLVEGGREFLVSVPGVMGSGLSDAQIAEVTNWLLATLAAGSVPPGQPPYTADEVQRARAHAPVDVAATRRTLVQRAAAQGLVID